MTSIDKQGRKKRAKT